MSQVLKDEVAIITGAGRGLGKAFALKFANAGAKLLLPDISLERAEIVAKEIRSNGGNAIAMETDISSENATKKMAEKVMEQYGRVDILLNNAAMMHGIQRRPWDSLTVEEWDQMFAVNVRGTWLCSKAIAPTMIKQGRGKIINISSTIMHSPGGHLLFHYACSKAAVKTMVQLLARELGPHGINVNAIAPGFTHTEAVMSQIDAEAAFERIVAGQCIKRREEPQDLVGTAVFLASKDSDFITGQFIVVDGGNWLR
ncbi:SDR family NAD(P)-dependent oxidoreductase [Chloroflexota bacterium]